MIRNVTLGYLVSWWALVMYVVFVSVLILERLVWSGLAKRSCLHPCWHLQWTWNVGSAFEKVLGTVVVWNTSAASSAHDHWRHDTCDVSLYFMHERCAVSSNRSSVLMLLMKTYDVWRQNHRPTIPTPLRNYLCGVYLCTVGLLITTKETMQQPEVCAQWCCDL